MSGEVTCLSFEAARTSRAVARTRCLSLLIFLLVCASLLCTGIASAGAPDKDGWTPIRFEDGQLLMPVTLNGIEGEAVIDSGAEINGIDEIFVREHQAELKFG